ncbi:MAG TPA: tetratricopeptide repeat protein, partial [Tahibacter sp.]|nr:tetratricopeptide repeat protein [Tahibacter sp.]
AQRPGEHGIQIAARASERWYRLRMLLRRHRRTAAVAAVLSLAVLATTAVSILQYFRAEAERDRAVEALASAQVQRDHAQHVADFLIDTFTAADPGRGRAIEMRAGELIEKAAAALENKSATLDPAMHARLAQTLSRLYFRLDRRDEALRQAVIARDTIATISDPPLEMLVRQDVAEAGAAVLRDEFAEAEEIARRGVERIGNPVQFSDTELLQQLWELRVRSAIELGQNAKALEYTDTALTILRARQDLRPEQIDWLRQRRAMVLSNSSNFRAALEEMKVLVAERRAANRVNDLYHVEILRLLGQSYARVGDYSAALTIYDEALAKYRELYGDKNSDERILMNLYGGIASVYGRVGRAAEAVQMFRRAIATAQAKYGTGRNAFISTAYFHLADCYYSKLGDFASAEFYFRRSLQTSPEQSRGSHAIYRRGFGGMLLLAGKLFEAAYELDQSYAELREVYGHGTQMDAAQINLAELRLQQFDLSSALAHLDGLTLDSVRRRPADGDSQEQAERLSAYFGWNRADGTTVVPPLMP